jgi:hypothetical protein
MGRLWGKEKTIDMPVWVVSGGLVLNVARKRRAVFGRQSPNKQSRRILHD